MFAPVSYYAAIVQALPTLLSICPDLSQCPIGEELAYAHAKILELGALKSDVLPTNFADIFVEFKESSPLDIQKKLTTQIEVILVKKLLDSGDDRLRARNNSASADGASLWLSTVPQDTQLFMQSQFTLALR